MGKKSLQKLLCMYKVVSGLRCGGESSTYEASIAGRAHPQAHR
jgi:hypothetical protein